MNWIVLIFAGLFEVLFAFCLEQAKSTEGISRYWWYGGFLTSLTMSMLLLIKATQHLPLGTAYAVWTGIGVTGTVLLGVLIFKDPASFWRIFFLVTLIASIIGLKSISH